MIGKLIVSVAAATLLAGCVTSDYAYRQNGRGDYYYGQPSTEYRYHGYGAYGAYGGYSPYRNYRHGYGYPYYGAYPGYYGYPYRPGYPVYPGYPHRPHHPRPPVVVNPDTPPPQGQPDNDRPPSWRNLDELRRRKGVDGPGTARRYEPASPTVLPRAMVQPRQPRPQVLAPQPRPQPQMRAPRSDSAMGARIREARQSRSPAETVEP